MEEAKLLLQKSESRCPCPFFSHCECVSNMRSQVLLPAKPWNSLVLVQPSIRAAAAARRKMCRCLPPRSERERRSARPRAPHPQSPLSLQSFDAASPLPSQINANDASSAARGPGARSPGAATDGRRSHSLGFPPSPALSGGPRSDLVAGPAAGGAPRAVHGVAESGSERVVSTTPRVESLFTQAARWHRCCARELTGHS